MQQLLYFGLNLAHQHKYGSGTEEEIEEMLSSNKQVFMYFLDAPISPSNVDMEQYKKVQAFEEKYKDRGIYFIVKDEHELRQLFTNHLGMHFFPLAVGKKTLFEKKENPLLINAPDLNKLLGKSDFAIEKIMDADITDRRKSIICKFAKENGIEIEDSFWNVRNLKIRVSTLVPFYGGSGTNFEGSEEEKKQYDSIEELYWATVDYYEYISFFEKMDKQGLVDLTVANIGNTFDEDIDIKIVINKNHICKIKDIAVPESNIIENEILCTGTFIEVYE